MSWRAISILSTQRYTQPSLMGLSPQIVLIGFSERSTYISLSQHVGKIKWGKGKESTKYYVTSKTKIYFSLSFYGSKCLKKGIWIHRNLNLNKSISLLKCHNILPFLSFSLSSHVNCVKMLIGFWWPNCTVL